MNTIIHAQFHDRAVFDSTTKTALSARDGVIEYYGHELGLEPVNKVFTVYRSPATIAKLVELMPNIPLTDVHVDTDKPVPEYVIKGRVIDAQPDDAFLDWTDSRLAIRNHIDVADDYLPILEEKKELSLGYQARLIPHDKYDFEQRDLIPHHLAVVDVGRNGSICSFIDKKTVIKEENVNMSLQKVHKVFKDEEGQLSMTAVAEIASSLPELIKTMPLDKLQELMVQVKLAVDEAKSAGADVSEIVTETVAEELTDEEKEKQMQDEDAEKEEEKAAFADSIKKSVDVAVKRHTEVIQKAQMFLDSAYNFADKSTEQIMRDALATETSEKFADSELNLAFKMLKKTESQYTNFGDSASKGSLEERVMARFNEENK